MTLEEYYAFGIRIFGAAAVIRFLLELVFGFPSALGWLDFVGTPVALYLAYLLARQKMISEMDRIVAVAPFFLLLKHFLNGMLTEVGFPLFLAVPFEIMLCLSVHTLLRVVEPKKKNVTADKDELGSYPIILNQAENHYITTRQTTEHIQIIGKSGSGKTASYFLSAANQVINYGLGAFIIDPKSEEIDKLVYYACEAGRIGSFYSLDLLNPNRSVRCNPLCKFTVDEEGNKVPDSDEVANIAYSALYFGDTGGEPFYRDLGKAFIKNFTRLFHKEFPVITFADYYHVVANELETFRSIQVLCDKYPESDEAQYFLNHWITASLNERKKTLAGLLNHLSNFVIGKWAPLINCREPDITMQRVVEENLIFHVGQAALVYPNDYKAITVAFLYDLMGEIGKRAKEKPVFHIFLDEFHNIAYPGFADIVNKSRSKNISVHLGHQSFGDLKQVSDAFEEQIIDSTTTKISFRILNDKTADRLARIIGTKEAELINVKSFKTNAGFMGGRQEAGETEKGKGERDFIVPPDVFKTLQKGEAVGLITYEGGVTHFQMQFDMAPMPPNSFDFRDYLPVLNLHLKPVEKSLPLKYGEVVATKKAAGKNEPEKEEEIMTFEKDNILEELSKMKKDILKDRKPRKATE